MINFLEKIMLRDKAYIFGSAGGGGGGGTSEEFSYTGKDQVYTVPKTGDYTIECFGAGSIDASGGYSKATFTLQEGDKLTLVAGQNGGSTSAVTYGYGGSSNYGSNCAGGGLSGVFTGDAQVTSSDASRALIIAGGAGSGGGVRGRGGAGGAETGEDGVNDGYGVVGSGGTQTGHGSSGNAGAAQFSGGNGSGTYGYGGGGGWRGGNGCIGDTSVHDDKGGGGGSCYIHTSGKNGIMTRGAGANVNENGKVIITSGGGGGEDEYEWLAYIEGTEHYLDTGILPGQSNYFRIDMRFMPLEDRIDRYFFCGGNISYAYNGMYFFNAGDSTGLLPHALSNEGQKYDATIAFGGGTILAKIANHPSMSGSYTGTLEHNSLLLFGDKNFQYSAHMRLYSLQLYEGDNDTITLSLKPCRRKKDGVLGMYDSVSGKFHPLVGKGYAPGDSTLAY